MADTYENSLLLLAAEYEQAALAAGGKSLARVATIVVNRGSFFDRLREGGGCSVRNLERFADWFRLAHNWPGAQIPDRAATSLVALGKPPIPADTPSPSTESSEAAA